LKNLVLVPTIYLLWGHWYRYGRYIPVLAKTYLHCRYGRYLYRYPTDGT